MLHSTHRYLRTVYVDIVYSVLAPGNTYLLGLQVRFLLLQSAQSITSISDDMSDILGGVGGVSIK